MSRKSYQKEVSRSAAQAAQQKKNQIRKIIIASLCVVLLALIVGGVSLLGSRDEGKIAAATQAPNAQSTAPVATDWIQIDIANYGTITAELYGSAAPITVQNFMKLVDEGFYNGLTFHRIISGFMIQGGDPLGNGTGGSPDKIKGEFASNGWQNDVKHNRGVLSMARSSMPDSASSQFFIMHQNAPHLDGSYAAFGKVLSGMEVVDAICAQTPVTDGNGSVAKANQPVITSIQRIEKP